MLYIKSNETKPLRSLKPTAYARSVLFESAYPSWKTLSPKWKRRGRKQILPFQINQFRISLTWPSPNLKGLYRMELKQSKSRPFKTPKQGRYRTKRSGEKLKEKGATHRWRNCGPWPQPFQASVAKILRWLWRRRCRAGRQQTLVSETAGEEDGPVSTSAPDHRRWNRIHRTAVPAPRK